MSQRPPFSEWLLCFLKKNLKKNNCFLNTIPIDNYSYTIPTQFTQWEYFKLPDLKNVLFFLTESIACPTCGKVYKTESQMKTHQREMHEEHTTHVCNICHHGFPYRSVF